VPKPRFSASARSTARRISEAVVSAPEGLSKGQIGCLFHGHVSKERIELALHSYRPWVSSTATPARARTARHHVGPGLGRQRCRLRELTRLTRTSSRKKRTL
jgi:hypothetical protein